MTQHQVRRAEATTSKSRANNGAAFFCNNEESGPDFDLPLLGGRILLQASSGGLEKKSSEIIDPTDS
ncbi:MAG: hypothetical protein R2873_31345 [Caldilineaceae bacterium]